MINMARVIYSPRMSQSIKIERTQAVLFEGEFYPQAPEEITMRGIITLARPEDTEQDAGGDRITGSIRVLTPKELYLTGDERISDVVIWRGSRYRVLECSPDIDWGFYRSTCVRLEGE